MAGAASKDFSRFGPELRRVRAGERTSDDGTKKVWHQASADIEVISHVDPAGRVTRQECFTSGTLVVWESGKRITTGSVSSGAQSAKVAASDTLVADAEPMARSVDEALTLLRAAPRGDKYLDHFLVELEAAADGLSADADDAVTSARQMVRERPPPPKAAVPVARLVALAAAGVGLGLLAWRALH